MVRVFAQGVSAETPRRLKAARQAHRIAVKRLEFPLSESLRPGKIVE